MYILCCIGEQVILSDYDFILSNIYPPTEAYRHRRPNCLPRGYGKAFHRVYFIKLIENGHAAVYKNGRLAVTEFNQQVAMHNGPNYLFNSSDIRLTRRRLAFTEETPKDALPVLGLPRYRLHHYLTKSIEHLMKKWVRGRATSMDHWGRPTQRPIAEIVEWASRYAQDWNVYDDNMLKNAEIIRNILHGHLNSAEL